MTRASRWAKIVYFALVWALLSCSTAFAAPIVLQPYQWQLLSVPGEPAGTVAQMFGNALPTDELGLSWVVFLFDASSNSYIQPSASDQIAASDAFWLFHTKNQPVTVDLATQFTPVAVESSSACSSIEGCVEHPLTPQGWTLIGSPSPIDMPISGVRLQAPNTACSQGCTVSEAVSAGLSNGVFYSYDEVSGIYEESDGDDDFVAGVGYWFHNTIPAGTEGARLLLPTANTAPLDIFQKAAWLGRGINLGAALESPVEGQWGITLEETYFDLIADAGFDSIRVPIKWSSRAMEAAPYTIEPTFFERIDWVLEQSERTGLTVVINMHHYEELMEAPDFHRDRYLSMWDQIASRYSDAPDNVFFELLNEPTGEFDDDPALWNQFLADAVAQVRTSNPERALIVGPIGWNVINRLPDLLLPADDQLIVTVHFYSPFDFTHQGATWVNEDGSPLPTGISFDPDSLSIGGSYQNWSWDTAVSLASNGLTASFARENAALNFRLLATDAPTQLNLTIGSRANLLVGCSDVNGFQFFTPINHTSALPQDYSIDLSTCGSGIQTVALQNTFAGATNFVMNSGEICSGTQCYSLFETAGDAITSELRQAAAFGTENNVPMYLGEFGAHDPGNVADRAVWTGIVQDSAISLGMTTSYWEFGANFGAYDRQGNGQWITPILDALLP